VRDLVLVGLLLLHQRHDLPVEGVNNRFGRHEDRQIVHVIAIERGHRRTGVENLEVEASRR